MTAPALPVSAAIEQEVTSYTSRHGLTLWLDRDGHYTTVVDKMAACYRSGEPGIPVVAFRGSWLELMLAMEDLGGRHTNDALLIHLPGHTEETIAETPALELWEAGTRFRKGLDTLVRDAAASHVAPTEIDAFVKGSELTLEKADAWLSARIVGRRPGLGEALDLLSVEQVTRELLVSNTMLGNRIADLSDVTALQEFLERQLGMDASWSATLMGKRHRRIGETPTVSEAMESLPEALAGWLFCVEYVNDLRRQPHLPGLRPLTSLPRPLIDRCKALVNTLRTEQPDRYVQLADTIEPYLHGELSQIDADDLGRIDTFREEEKRVLIGSLSDLLAGRWVAARDKVAARQDTNSFWLQRDQGRRWAWTLVGHAAAFGTRLDEFPRPLEGCSGFEAALSRYTEQGASVDRAHRQFEQARNTYLEPRLPHFVELKDIVEALRLRYRAWADRLALDFSTLCKKHGFLPDASLRQRTLYEQVVHPMLASGNEKVALFVIDALRFEMAAELAEELRGPGVTVDLKPRLAELPTLTSIGMNALAPVARSNGVLTPVMSSRGAFGGFRTGEYTVRGVEDRARAMGERSVGRPAMLLKLSDLWDAPLDRVKRQVAQGRLIIIHGREIDDAGEANFGLSVFEQTLRQLRATCLHLQSVGIRNFVFTADHGFMLVDPTVKQVSLGLKTEPSRRHVVSPDPRGDDGMVAVPLSSLAYEGVQGHLLLREDTALFDTGSGSVGFAHGGNSPQERIIPVLTVQRRRSASAARTVYHINVQIDIPTTGLPKLRLSVITAPGENESLGFFTPGAVGLALRADGREDVQVTVKEVTGATLDGGRIMVQPGQRGVDVYFALEGPRDERVRIEIYHPDGVEAIEPIVPGTWFNVSGTASHGGTPTSVNPTNQGDDWLSALPDEVRSVFAHIGKHGAVTEEELGRLLGSPRAARRFAVNFETHLPLVPFIVRIETTERGKRYVKERLS